MTEHEIQKMLFQWAAYNPALRWMFAIPLGGYRPIATAVKMKAEGARSGVPDIFLPVPRGNHHGLFIEMKTEKGRVTANQKEWIHGLKQNGYRVEVCRGFDEAVNLINEYLYD